MSVGIDTTIRSASRSDVEAMFALLRSVYESTDMMCDSFAEKYPAISVLEDTFDDLASIKGAQFLVAEDTTGFTGYVMIEPLKQVKLAHTAHLTMGVHPRSRGKSVGKLLLTEALKRIEEQPIIEILYLHVREDNEPAVKLYNAFGFETIARLERDTKIGDRYFTALMMRLFFKRT